MDLPVPSELCPGCGGRFPAGPGTTHRYMESSPGCWAIYGEVLAREYSDAAYFAVHRLTVDAYAAQHPGQPSPQSIQSVAVHLSRLCLMLEHDLSAEQSNSAMLKITQRKASYRWLEPPPERGGITVADVHRAESATEHMTIVRAWAYAVWMAWSPHHAQIRAWLSPQRVGAEPQTAAGIILV